MRLGARVVGKRVGALVVGMARGATVVGAAVGVAANCTRVSCWHMGRMGKGNEWRGWGADVEVVLQGGSGTGQYWQYFRPSSSLLPLRRHKPHRPLTVASVTRTSVRMDHGLSSPTRLNHAVSRLLSTN
jgi:hypothetical protein